ncbi:MAG: GIY-YIG nuclease family protein [Candidatus Bathyarchaeota archaeon]|nr:MAG: GIY-YIG nuclease family protein [Candidatus Bathyarchaeota archaeon]
MPYYVYILLCKNGSFYTGHARNVEQRVKRHKKGRGARYIRIHELERIVYVEEFESRSEAMKREREIKSFSHRKKQQLAELYSISQVGVAEEQSEEQVQHAIES